MSTDGKEVEVAAPTIVPADEDATGGGLKGSSYYYAHVRSPAALLPDAPKSTSNARAHSSPSLQHLACNTPCSTQHHPVLEYTRTHPLSPFSHTERRQGVEGGGRGGSPKSPDHVGGASSRGEG